MNCSVGDESGKVVDWYVVYKFPRVTGAKSPLDTGFQYAFITNDTTTGWTLSQYEITDAKKSIFGQTLQSLYATSLGSDVTYIDYNDEPPDEAVRSGGAHAKGVVASDTTQGFWLIHSVPKFVSNEVFKLLEYNNFN